MIARRGVAISGVGFESFRPDSLLLIVVAVDLRKARPLFRQIVKSENRRYRAHRDTGPAVDALYWVDVYYFSLGKVGLVLPWMDAVHWACIYARRVLNANTRLRDYVCHLDIPRYTTLELTAYATRFNPVHRLPNCKKLSAKRLRSVG